MRIRTWILTVAVVLALGGCIGSAFGRTAASIAGLKVGKDKPVTEETDSFGPTDTIYAAARIINVAQPVNVKAQLVVEDIPGQNPGPIKGLESTMHMLATGTATFSFSAPTKGWPKGKYGIDVVLLDEHGETLDHKTAEFTVD